MPERVPDRRSINKALMETGTLMTTAFLYALHDRRPYCERGLGVAALLDYKIVSTSLVLVMKEGLILSYEKL